MKKILLLICAVIAIALTLITFRAPAVKASGGSICLGNCSPPVPPVTCINGGTNPAPGVEFGYPYHAAEGVVTFGLLGGSAGCRIQVTGLDASYIDLTPASNPRQATLAVWESSSSTCSPVLTYDYLQYVGVDQQHPAEHLLLGKGGVAQSLTPGNYVCAGFNQNNSTGLQSIMVYFDYE